MPEGGSVIREYNERALSYAHIPHTLSEIRSFYSSKIKVRLLGGPIGQIWTILPGPPVPASISASNISAQNAADELDDFFASSLRTNVVVPEIGRYINPNLPSLAMDHTFSNQRVKAQDILTCIMRALLIISSNGAEDFEYINAMVPNLALNIHATTAPDDLPKQAAISLCLWNLMQLFKKLDGAGRRVFLEVIERQRQSKAQ
ncbi:MAG: hypothetical protein Q9208_004586 [Pyrenodesmia sp. 3 TL-2023]